LKKAETEKAHVAAQRVEESPRRPGHVFSAPWGDPPPFWPPAPADRAALTDVYRRVEAVLDDFPDACRRCGKCCRFEPGGIILFASAPEMAHLVSEAGPPPAGWHGRAPLRGHAPADFGTHGHATARGHATPLLDVAWRCPYQEGNLCAAREGRLLGCRTHFCDATARAVGERVHDDALREIRQIAHGADNRWWYGPARVCLEAWCAGAP
jgi:Fe-S-cluster containining protein